MKKLNFISFLIFLVFIGACNVFNSYDEGQRFEYQFKTDKTEYSLKDTVNATFKNKSDQTLFLSYQICTIAEMQKHENKNWKSISIPIFCPQYAKSPVKVEPGEKIETGVNLNLFDKNDLASGTYRLDVVASQKDQNKQRELTSNNFEISK
ncbi:hypothetical protein [Fodinibius sp. AD559]|uniref:hypothetical protein n=1 Tax=Fodinibius sp. AD559 TaxID=3424179 RepID=UPI0040469671